MDGRMTDAEEALAPFSFLVSSLLFPEGGGGFGGRAFGLFVSCCLWRNYGGLEGRKRERQAERERVN